MNKKEKPEKIVISLGGSLIFSEKEKIDWQFLKEFRQLIVSEIKKGKKFIIITGGGKICREYQEAANKVINLTNDDKDWLGVHATRLNAHLIKTIFRYYAHPRINKNPNTKANLNEHFAHGESIMVAAGWRPGWSTDFVSTILARRMKAKTVINLSNVKYVFNKDPDKFKDVRKVELIDWKGFRKIVGTKWKPGANLPFDPIASKEAQKNKLKVIIVDGKNMENLKKVLQNKPFKGTIIEDKN